MSNRSRFLVLAGVVALVGTLALHVCGSVSEAFYVVIPPVALAWYLTGVENLREAFDKRLRPGLAIVGAIFVASLVVGLIVFGPGVALSWKWWLEVAACLYWLAAALVIILAVRRALLAFAETLHARWQFAPGVRMIVCEVVPLVLFVLVAAPYAMAFAQVHRFKMPNFSEPRTFWNREYEDVEFRSADGTILRGWWIPAKSPSSRTLVFCHGVAANRSIFLPFAETGDWLDANVLMFDLRGCGDSGGRTVTLGYREKEDVLAAIAWIRRERPEQARQVIGMGVSLGAASMAEAAALVDPPLDAVILDSCFTSTHDMSASILSVLPAQTHPWLMTLGAPMADWHAGCAIMSVRPEESIGKVRAPILFLHSRGDPLIPSEHATRLFERAAEPKKLCVFELPGHCDSFFASRERYREEVVAMGERVRHRQR